MSEHDGLRIKLNTIKYSNMNLNTFSNIKMVFDNEDISAMRLQPEGLIMA